MTLQGGLAISLLESLIKQNKTLPGVRVIVFLQINIELSVDITVSDINPDMLEVGKRRALDRGSFHGNHCLCYFCRSQVHGTKC